MDQVRIRAAVHAHGMRKHQEAIVAETPVIAGGIKNGAFILLERFSGVEPTEADDASLHAGVQDEPPVPLIEDVELPGLASTDDGETPATEYQPRG